MATFVALAHVGAGTISRLDRDPAAELTPTATSSAAPTATASAAASARPVSSAASAAPCRSGTAKPPTNDAAWTSDGRLILNLAGEGDLVKLPQIGLKRAQAIVALRGKLGRFRHLRDLLRIRGIGPRVLTKLEPRLVLDPPPPTQRDSKESS